MKLYEEYTTLKYGAERVRRVWYPKGYEIEFDSGKTIRFITPVYVDITERWTTDEWKRCKVHTSTAASAPGRFGRLIRWITKTQLPEAKVVR